MGISYDKAVMAIKKNPNYAMRLEGDRGAWDEGLFMSWSAGQEALPPERFWSKVNRHIASNAFTKTLKVNGGFSLSDGESVTMGYIPSLRDELKDSWVVYEFSDDPTVKPKRVNIK